MLRRNLSGTLTDIPVGSSQKLTVTPFGLGLGIQSELPQIEINITLSDQITINKIIPVKIIGPFCIPEE
jgi:hypothetical protein